MRGTGHVHSGRIPYLDGWRGVSLLAVLAGHFGLDSGMGLAQLGVELFFVLSGRLMADILFVERYPLLRFYKRRFSRIFPGLAAFVGLTFLGTMGTAFAFKPAAAVLALTFTLNYAMVLSHGVAVIENIWSLCIEEHAYLLLGLVALVARRGKIAPIPFLSLLAAASLLDGAASTLVFHQDYRHAYWRSDAHVSSILMGAVAYLTLPKARLPAWTSPLAFVAGLVAWMGPDVVRYSAASACFAVAMGALNGQTQRLPQILSWKPLGWFGVWSYSVYLWQQPFERLMLKQDLPAWGAVALSLFFGLASFYYVEQPARRYLNREKPKRGAQPQPESPPEPLPAPLTESLAVPGSAAVPN